MKQKNDSIYKKKDLVDCLINLSPHPLRTLLRFVLSLLFIELILIALHLFSVTILGPAITKDGQVALFDLNEELTFASWFSSIQFLILSLIGLLLAWSRSDEKMRWLWIGCFVFFLFMSLDETSGIHEAFSGVMEKCFSFIPLSGSILWAIPYALVLSLILTMSFLCCLSHIPSIAGLILGSACWIGAVTVEIHHLPSNYALSIVIEEGLEMAGTTFLIYAYGYLLIKAR